VLERVFPLALVLCSSAVAQRGFVLTDTAANVHLDDLTITPALLGLEGDWSVTRTTLRGGKQEGVDSITIKTGEVTAVVLPTRGMNVYEVRCGEHRLGWDSPSAEIVHPALVDLESRGGLGWLEGFNEWMVRCGLEYAGHPGTDEFTTNTGDTATLDLTLHGRIGHLPATRVELIVDGDGRLRLVGTAYERMFYGPKLRLDSEFSVKPGERAWRISDMVTNVGAAPQEFQLIYHGNYGAPLLGEGARLVVPARSIAPMNAKAAGAIDTWDVYRGPTAGFLEEVYLIEPYSNARGTTAALLIAPGGRLATSVSWNVNELPYFTQWKNTAAEADGYVTGMEPATGFPFNRKVERAAGRVPTLAPGEARSFTLDFALHLEDEVVAAEARVRAIQGERVTERRGLPE
jgi:hypothetical protein